MSIRCTVDLRSLMSYRICFTFDSEYMYVRRLGDLSYYVILGFLDLVIFLKEGSDMVWTPTCSWIEDVVVYLFS